MKQQYESAWIKFILIDGCDVITTSDPGTEGPIGGTGPIGGSGYDANGWT
jgi:hypothetical protein